MSHKFDFDAQFSNLISLLLLQIQFMERFMSSPSKLFWCRRNSRSEVKFPIPPGMPPVSLLSAIEKTSTFDRFPKEDGIVPVNLLLNKDRVRSSGYEPIHDGRTPENMLLAKSIKVNLFKKDNSFGSSPLRLLFPTLSTVRDERFPKLEETFPQRFMLGRRSELTLLLLELEVQLTPNQLQTSVPADQFVAKMLFESNLIWDLKSRRES